MPRCSGKCELQIINIITNPILATISTDPRTGGPMPATPWAKADSDAATAALLARINTWKIPTATSGCPVLMPPNPAIAPPIPCICTQTGPNPPWKDMPTLTRQFAEKFKSNGSNWEAWVDIDYQIGYVVGTCLEPPGFIFYSMGTTGIIEGQGLAVLASAEGALTAEKLDKMRKALG